MATTEQPDLDAFEAVALDLYRDVHKGIRADLFAVTLEAGRIDPTNRAERDAVCAHVHSMTALLIGHAGHEDRVIQPVLERELPDGAEQIERDHHMLEARMANLAELADTTVELVGSERDNVHRLYRELASFTSAYLAHQDTEERVMMPGLMRAVGIDAVVGMHVDIVSNMPPAEMFQAMTVMLPAMNIDDRTELLGGMQASAPPEAFNGIWGLATSLLSPADTGALAARLGIE